MTQSAPSSLKPADILFDEWLVMSAQAGDARAFERLHARWQMRIARAAYRYTACPETARDLAQDCWVGIWKGLGRLQDPSRFRAYAFGVLHRRGADYIRGAITRRARHATLQEGEDIPDPASQAERSALNQAFAALSADQRLAAHLHFVEGLTLNEIADAQSIPTGTAKSRLFHARRKLKAALNEHPQGEAS